MMVRVEVFWTVPFDKGVWGVGGSGVRVRESGGERDTCI